MASNTDPTNPLYHSFQTSDVNKLARNEPITLADWLITAFIVGLFAVGIIISLLTQ